METEPREDLFSDKEFRAIEGLQQRLQERAQGLDLSGGESRSDSLTIYTDASDPNLPANVRQLPPNAIEKWVKTYNSKLRENTSESQKERKRRAMAAAWGSLNFSGSDE